MLNHREIETLLVDHGNELLRHLDEREDDSFLLGEASFEIVVFDDMLQFISYKRLSHQPGHA